MQKIDTKKIEKLRSCVNLIKKSFECTICLDYFDDPVLTNCQHAFCKKCIENFIGTKRSQMCPLCKKSINLRSLNKFPSLSYFVANTKKLEETFHKDLINSQQNLKQDSIVKSSDSSNAKNYDETNKENIINSSDSSSLSYIGTKRKRRSISNEDKNFNKKSKANELSTTNSIITSTRDDIFSKNTDSTSIPNTNPINIIEETIIENKENNKPMLVNHKNNLNILNNNNNNNKVEEWLDKNIENDNSATTSNYNDTLNEKDPKHTEKTNNKPNPLVDSTNKINGNASRSAITITKIRFDNNKNLINNKSNNNINNNDKNESRIPLLNLGDFNSTDQGSNKELTINEADINLNFNNDENRTRINPITATTTTTTNNNNDLTDLSKIDYPLKFTKENPGNNMTDHNVTYKSKTFTVNTTTEVTPKQKKSNLNSNRTPKTASTARVRIVDPLDKLENDQTYLKNLESETNQESAKNTNKQSENISNENNDNFQLPELIMTENHEQTLIIPDTNLFDPIIIDEQKKAIEENPPIEKNMPSKVQKLIIPSKLRNLKRSKSVDSKLNLTTDKKCESCQNKKKFNNPNPYPNEKPINAVKTTSSSTNTDVISKCDVSIQVDMSELCFNLLDYSKIETQLINSIYEQEETRIIDLILNDYFKSISTKETPTLNRKNSSLSIQSIPDSPPNQKNQETVFKNPNNNQMNESIIQQDNNVNENRPDAETSLITSNESVNRKSALFLKENFSDLLNTSTNSFSANGNKKTTRKDSINQKRKPSLEFLTTKNTSFLNNSANLNESINSNRALGKERNVEMANLELSILDDQNKKDKNMPRMNLKNVDNNTIDDTLHVEHIDQNQNQTTLNESLIIEDTPIKNSEQSEREDLREMNETLSKSANRLEAVNNKILFENSIIRFENSFINNSNSSRTKENENNGLRKSINYGNDTTILFENTKDNIDQTRLSTSPKTNVQNVPKPVETYPVSTDLVITDTVQITGIIENQNEIVTLPKTNQNNQDSDTTVILNNNSSLNQTKINEPVESKSKYPLKKIAPQVDNQSLLLNSLNMTNHLVAPSTLFTLSDTLIDKSININKQPPAARDILGTSLSNVSTYSVANSYIEPPEVTDKRTEKSFNVGLNTSTVSKSLSNEKPKEQNEDHIQKQKSPQTSNQFREPNNASIESKSNTNKEQKKNDQETQLLTDSACFMIENICKDFYSIQNQTICEEPTQEARKTKPKSIVFSNSGGSSERRIEFVFSLLSHEMKDIVGKFAKNHNIIIANDVTDTTTHLIVDSDKNLLCGVTCKYLKAISRKLWIVSIAWILNCINTGQFMKPDKFEIRGDKSFGIHNGPIQSRTSSCHLYESYEFLFIGEFLSADSVSLEDITQLVILNKGIVRRKAKDFSQDDPTKKKIVIFDEKAKKISLSIAKSLKESEIDCVNKSWLIDSLACFKLRDMKDYQTYDEKQ